MRIEDLISKVKAGDVLIDQGDISENIYWLKEGLCVVTQADLQDPDKVISLGNINAGELFGEMSFLDSNPRSATVTALTDGEILTIPKDKYQTILKQQPQWMQNLIQNLVDRLRKTNSKVLI